MLKAVPSCFLEDSAQPSADLQTLAAADDQEFVSDVPSETPGTETLSKCPAEKEG